MEGRRIVKGENFELPGDIRRLHIVLGWNDTTGERTLDASALLLDAERKVASDADFVFYNQPASVDGSVSLLGQTVTDNGVEERLAIDLEAVPAGVATIALAASVDKGRFGDLRDLRLVVLDGAGGQVARYDITDATEESAFVFGEVYRRNDAWKVRAVGQGWANGLAGLATLIINRPFTPPATNAIVPSTVMPCASPVASVPSRAGAAGVVTLMIHSPAAPLAT